MQSNLKNRFKKRAVTCGTAVIDGLFDPDLAAYVANRGITPDNAADYFGEGELFDPFLMHGMREAVEIIGEVAHNEGSILIFGDYDADGISASAILKLFFDEFEMDSRVVLPTRQEGYGLNVDTVMREYGKQPFDLLLTVDCGISNADEIATLAERGITVIVTDHHELPERLPDCVCVNPKFEGYPFKYLSGSGVAYKLVEAMADGDTVDGLIALAAVGTIADMMPLLSENRAIVKRGLASVGYHIGLSALCSAMRCKKPYTVYDFSMKVCPCINAAGRIGDPTEALAVMTAIEDAPDCSRLTEINARRKEMVLGEWREALEMLTDYDFAQNNCVIVAKDDWQAGLVGLTASRLKERFGMSAFVMRAEGDCYVGSARGAESVNLVETLNSVSDILVRYGGHRSSAGFTVEAGKTDEFKRRLTESFSRLKRDDGYRYYDMEFKPQYLSNAFSNALSALEPMHVNERPVFYVKGKAESVSLFGDGKHLSVKLNGGLQLKGFFEYVDYYKPLLYGEAEYLFTLEYSDYDDCVSGVIKEINLLNSLRIDEIYAERLLRNLGDNRSFVGTDSVKGLLDSDDVLVIFASYEEFLDAEKLMCFDGFRLSFFETPYVCGKNILIAPRTWRGHRFKNTIGVVGDLGGCGMDCDITLVQTGGVPYYLRNTLNREVCSEAYKALRKATRGYPDLKALYEDSPSKNGFGSFLAASKVFGELGLADIGEYPLSVSLTEGRRAELTSSSLYMLCERKGDL